MAFLGLQAIDRQDQTIDVAIFLGQDLGILLPSGQHGLIPLDVIANGIMGERDLVRVGQFGAKLRDRPVIGETPVADPAKDIPADEPMRHRDGRFGQRTERRGTTGTAGVGTMCQLADELRRTL